MLPTEPQVTPNNELYYSDMEQNSNQNRIKLQADC